MPRGASDVPVEFSYQLNGETHHFSELRGRPVLLVLIRVSEVTSMMYLDEVRAAFAKSAGKTRFLVLSIEPNEAPLLEPFVEIEKLPFPIGLAEWNVATGNTSLGVIPLVPTTYLCDEDGVVVDMAPGVTSAARIESVLAARGF